MKLYILIYILALMLSVLASQPDNSEPQTFTDIINTHRLGNISDLAERSQPGANSEILKLSFYDILKIRSLAIAHKIPEPDLIIKQLSQVIDENNFDTRIHRFAAEQALFCINTPKALDILKKNTHDSRHNSSLAINYTSHWEMPEPQRSCLISKYYAVNLSDSIQVTLNTKPGPDYFDNSISIVATIKNISDNVVNYVNDDAPLGNKLYFKNSYGLYTNKIQLSHKDFPYPKVVKLLPGDSFKLETTLLILVPKPQHNIYDKYLKGNKLWVTEDPWNAFLVEKPGKFEIAAVFEYFPNKSEWLIKTLGTDDFWTGQAVSQPINITLDTKNNNTK